MNITMERITSTAPLNAAQRAFLTLHARHLVTEWRWHFGTMLRANADGRRATIWRDDLEALVALGFMMRGAGCADYRVTALGRAAAEAV